MRRFAPIAAVVMLGACGSSTVSPSGGTSSPRLSPASGLAIPTGPAAAGSTWSCDIKAGTGLLPGATPQPGRLLASSGQIEQAIGFTISQSADITEIAGIHECQYQFDNGTQLNLAVVEGSSQGSSEFQKTQSSKLALVDRACNGCTLSGVTPLPGYGDQAFQANNQDGATVDVLKGSTYFELASGTLKMERLLRLAQVIAGNVG